MGGGEIRGKGKWEPPVAKLLGNQGRYTGLHTIGKFFQNVIF